MRLSGEHRQLKQPTCSAKICGMPTEKRCSACPRDKTCGDVLSQQQNIRKTGKLGADHAITNTADGNGRTLKNGLRSKQRKKNIGTAQRSKKKEKPVKENKLGSISRNPKIKNEGTAKPENDTPNLSEEDKEKLRQKSREARKKMPEEQKTEISSKKQSTIPERPRIQRKNQHLYERKDAQTQSRSENKSETG